MKKVITIAMTFIMCLSLVGCIQSSGGSGSEEESNDSSNEPITNVSSEEAESSGSGKNTVALGESFEYSGYTITFGTEAKWSTIDDKYDDLNGSTIFAIPCTVTNNNEESGYLNSYDYVQYGPDGKELASLSYSLYDLEDSITNSGNLRTGASYDGFIYFLYTTDGDYVLEFTDYTETFDTITTEVTVPIAKG